MDRERKNTSDHDLLIRIDERTKQMAGRLDGHMRRHWAVTAAAIGALFTSLGGLVLLLISLQVGG